MTAATPQVSKPGTRELAMNRVIAAPRSLIFRAWTDPRQLARWCGPEMLTSPACESDPRPGGAYRIVVRSPEGVDCPVTGVCREAVPPARPVLTNSPTGAPADWMRLLNEYRQRPPEVPLQEMLVTVTLDERDGHMLLTTATTFESSSDREELLKRGMAEECVQSLDRLVALCRGRVRLRAGSGEGSRKWQSGYRPLSGAASRREPGARPKRYRNGIAIASRMR